MNIKQLHIIASVDPKSGGPIQVLLNSALAISSHGHSIDVVTLDGPGAPCLRDLPFPVHPLGPSTETYQFSSRLIPWLLANASRYHVVVIHGLWNFSSVGAWLALRGQGTPYLVFAHGMLDPWFRSAYPLKHWLKQIYWSAFEGRVLRDAAAVLFTANEERRLARFSFWGHPYRERIVPLGITDVVGDPAIQKSAFLTAFPNLRSRKFLLFLSRLHPKKGIDLLISAFAKLATQHPDLDLVVAGPDQLGWQAELQKQAERLRITNRIHWPGMLTGDLKWGAFRCAEAFVLPSHQENFGIVIAEAMACSLPVLTTLKVNIWQEVEEAGAGLISKDTEEGVSELLQRYVDLSHDEKDEMRSSARKGFCTHFTIEAAATELVRICEEVAAKRASD